MNDRDHHRMLREILAGDESSDLRKASLEAGLALLRRQRQRRRVLRFGVALCLPITLLFVFLPIWKPTLPVAPASVSPGKTAGIKIIGDAELFALFPGRPLALIGPPGKQELVFLDQPQAENP